MRRSSLARHALLALLGAPAAALAQPAAPPLPFPEALSRAFSALKKAGVTVRGRIVQVNDVAALKQI